MATWLLIPVLAAIAIGVGLLIAGAATIRSSPTTGKVLLIVGGVVTVLSILPVALLAFRA